MSDQKTAFISGSGRNIGRAMALDFARDNIAVILNGSSNRNACDSVAEEVRKSGGTAHVIMGDVGDGEEVERMADEVLSLVGRVDIVINNASIRPSKPFLEMSHEEWHRVISVDMHSAFYTAQAFLPGMVEAGWGRIVNITGMNAIHGYSGRAPVSVAKHGLWGLTKSLAKEFGPKGITVNAISPGPIESENMDPDQASHIRSFLDKIPVGHLGAPTDISAMTSLMCSDRGRFINGQMFAINGGTQT